MSYVRNPNDLVLHVTLGNGRQIAMNVRAGELYADRQGWIWLISLTYDDGMIGNYVLMRHRTTKDQVLEFTRKYLAPLGVEIAGHVLKHKYRDHPQHDTINLAVFLGEKAAPTLIDRVFERIEDGDQWGYYELASGELVIRHAVQVDIG